MRVFFFREINKAFNEENGAKAKKFAKPLAMGCIVVRKAFLEAHTNEVVKFLEEYKASIDFVNQSPAEASEMVVALGIYTGAAAVAAKAIPSCNIVYMDKADMAVALDVFFAKLYSVNPASVGGTLPDSNIYYGK